MKTIIKNNKFIIASSKNWSFHITENLKQQIPDAIINEVSSKEELNIDNLSKISPSFIFFPHWSYIIPDDILDKFTCVVFHMTDLPFGRGGSPLQNLISRGIFETQISAIKCVKELDGGPIYLKRPLSLYGNAEEIYIRGTRIVAEMIVWIIQNTPEPVEQNGNVVIFPRRKPEQSNIGSLTDLEKLFHHIRMLDAEGYPAAFLETEYFRFEFSRASLKRGRIIADVEIKEKSL
jgi:methionyl-tRNA formyltransferase